MSQTEHEKCGEIAHQIKQEIGDLLIDKTRAAMAANGIDEGKFGDLILWVCAATSGLMVSTAMQAAKGEEQSVFKYFMDVLTDSMNSVNNYIAENQIPETPKGGA